MYAHAHVDSLINTDKIYLFYLFLDNKQFRILIKSTTLCVVIADVILVFVSIFEFTFLRDKKEIDCFENLLINWRLILEKI